MSQIIAIWLFIIFILF